MKDADYATVLQFECPTCGAKAGFKCTNYRGIGCAPHRTRAHKANGRELLALAHVKPPVRPVQPSLFLAPSTSPTPASDDLDAGYYVSPPQNSTEKDQ